MKFLGGIAHVTTHNRLYVTLWPWHLNFWPWSLSLYLASRSPSNPSTCQCPVIFLLELLDCHGNIVGSRVFITEALANIHCVSKKFPPLNWMQLCQILTDFQNFCTAGKRMKFATKLMRQYPSHLRHVATLPWEITNTNFLQTFSKHCRNANILYFNRL